MIKLCVNIDHVATLRQARGTVYPDPLDAAVIAESAGAAGITVHLREDRRHIQDDDLFRLRDRVSGKLNLEMALSEEITAIALRLMPDQITLVPEKREEITTEGGLDVMRHRKSITQSVKTFRDAGIIVSLFIEPDPVSVDLSAECGAEYVEFHTGAYCNSAERKSSESELNRIFQAAGKASSLKLGVNAGHGLNYENLSPVLDVPYLDELNIGHSIVSRAVIVGMETAVKEMLQLIKTGHPSVGSAGK